MLMDYDAIIRVKDNVLELIGYQRPMTKAPTAIIDTVILVAVGPRKQGNHVEMTKGATKSAGAVVCARKSAGTADVMGWIPTTDKWEPLLAAAMTSLMPEGHEARATLDDSQGKPAEQADERCYLANEGFPELGTDDGGDRPRLAADDRNALRLTRSKSRNVEAIDSKSSPCLVGNVGTAELEGEEHEPPLSFLDILPNEKDTGKPFADYFYLEHLDDDTKQQVLHVLEEYNFYWTVRN